MLQFFRKRLTKYLPKNSCTKKVNKVSGFMSMKNQSIYHINCLLKLWALENSNAGSIIIDQTYTTSAKGLDGSDNVKQRWANWIQLGYKVSLWPTQNSFVLVNIYFDSIGIRLGLNPPSLILNLKKPKWKQKSITKRLEKAKVPNIFHTASESVSLWPT